MSKGESTSNYWHGLGPEERYARTRTAQISNQVRLARKGIAKALEILTMHGYEVTAPENPDAIVVSIATEMIDERARKAASEAKEAA